jgi:hypothetical protein
MAYGYVQGRESEALAFYERLLSSELADEERSQIAALVARLSELTSAQAEPLPDDISSVTFCSAGGGFLNAYYA